MAITILIVDDEKLERRGIRLLLGREAQREREENLSDQGWEEQEYTILEAENGKAALGILAEQRVDLLFSDVKMPSMNGLELTKRARELYPELEIVIFSGYNDFTYAREALRCGVVDYVLKPVDPAEFHKTFVRVREGILARRKADREKRRQKAGLEKYFLQRYLYSGKEEELKNLSELEKAQGGEGVPFHLILAESQEGMFETEEERFVESLKEHLGREFFYLNLNANESLFLFRERYTDYEKLAEQMYRYFRQTYDVECYFAVSHALKGIRELPPAFGRLEQTLEEMFYQPSCHVFGAEGESGQEDVQETEDARILEHISEDIRCRDIARLRQDFHRLEMKYGEKAQFSEMYVKFVFSGILKEIYEQMDTVGEKELARKVDRLYRCRTIREVLQNTGEAVAALEQYYQEKSGGFRKEVAQVKSFIYHNYDKNLSVELLAGQVYLSAGYLSAVFKEETGMNLNRFIREVRLNRAKELLEGTNMKIGQVAKAVGFVNASYFGRSFREFFGETPEYFRRESENVRENGAQVQ